MQNTTLFLPGFHLQSLRKTPRSARQKLADKTEEIWQKSFSQLGECFGKFIFYQHLRPAVSGNQRRRRIFSKENTFWACFSQILDADGGCKEAVHKLQAFAALKSNSLPSSSTSAYCQARMKLDQPSLEAILHDMEFLNVTKGALYSLTCEAIETRNNWFKKPRSGRELIKLFDQYFDALSIFLEDIFNSATMYVPERSRYQVAPNILLENQPKLGYRRTGVVLPNILRHIGPKYFNLQNKLNNFVFCVPFTTLGVSDHLADRFLLIDALDLYNKRYLPHFAIMTSSLRFSWANSYEQVHSKLYTILFRRANGGESYDYHAQKLSTSPLRGAYWRLGESTTSYWWRIRKTNFSTDFSSQRCSRCWPGPNWC